MPLAFFDVFRLLFLWVAVSRTPFLVQSTSSNFRGRLLWLKVPLPCSSPPPPPYSCGTRPPSTSRDSPVRLTTASRLCTPSLGISIASLARALTLIISIPDIFVFRFRLFSFCEVRLRILFLTFIFRFGLANLREDLLRLLMIVLDFRGINLMSLNLLSFSSLSLQLY